MTFSLRDLMALVLLLSLAMLAWRTAEQARRDQAQAALLQAEIEQLEARLRLDKPAIHQAILRTADEFEPLEAMRERALAHFQTLRQRHSAMAPQGADTLSLRSVPSLPSDEAPAPTVFRLWAPQARPVWLKFAVHQRESSAQAASLLDNDPDLLTESLFTVSGPFEIRLPPGDQTLGIAVGSAQDGSLPVTITLDDKTLLRTAFTSPDVSGTGSASISAPLQLDYPAGQELPWLLTARISLRSDMVDRSNAFSVWLSDRPSHFERFPGE